MEKQILHNKWKVEKKVLTLCNSLTPTPSTISMPTFGRRVVRM